MSTLHAISGRERIEFKQELLLYQLRAIGILCLVGIPVLILIKLFPTYFVYPYFKWGGVESVLAYWPMFAWGMFASLVLSGQSKMHASENVAIFGYELITSTLAGIWEELGYRCIFIFYTMTSIIVLNWFFGSGLGWMLCIGLGVACVVLIAQARVILSIICFLLAIAAFNWTTNFNPIFWIYENIIVTVIHYTTFTFMDPVLYNGHDKLFLFGAILANSHFRDGHEYQGTLGFINSWYLGMALLFATVTYGLITAIVVHIVYDVICGLGRFIVTRTHS